MPWGKAKRERPTPRERKELLEAVLGEYYPTVVLHLVVASDAELADFYAGAGILLKQLEAFGSDGREDMFGTLHVANRISTGLYVELKDMKLTTLKKVLPVLEHF